MSSVVVVAALVVPAAAAFSAGEPSPGAAVPVAGTRHRSGLAIVGEQPVPPPLPEAVSGSLGRAERLVQENPRDFGYVWVDRATGQVMLDVVTAKGKELAGDLGEKLAAKPVRQRPKARRVARSQQAVERVKHQVIELDGVWASEVDPQTGRVVVTVRELTDTLAREITSRYGTEDVAVRVEPGYQPPGPTSSRDDDDSPYRGGARIWTLEGSCTSGFGWQESSSKTYMLTAGHCIPEGGGVASPSPERLGWVTEDSGENWEDGVGTRYLERSTVYRGDLALIEMEVDNGQTSAGRIYRGGPTSSTYANVAGMLSRAVAPGDTFCVGGATTGELCGWTVASVGVNIRYASGAIARNMVSSEKKYSGKCARGGDSGGPVYQVRTDGKVTALGIISGSWGGGRDEIAGRFDPCRTYFTDIRQAYYGFPGTIQTS